MANLSLHHIVRESSLKENAPLLVLFHGYGSDENDLFSFASELPEADKGKWSDNEQAKESRDKISNFIDEITANYPIDKDNVTLLGFSQGTILSYAVALNYPKKIKNIIALSGYINEDLFKLQTKENYSHLNFYCSHGSVDQVIPVDWARKTSPYLENLNIKYSYSEFPVGHGVAPQNFFEFRDWLKTKI